VLLCKVINVIEPGTIKKIDDRQIQLVYVENINSYLKSCYKLGMPSSDLFVNSDLASGKGIVQVVTNVNSLVRLAQSKKDWKGPTISGMAVQKQNQGNAVKKWDPIQTGNQFKTVEDLEQQHLSTVECTNCKKRIQKELNFCNLCGAKVEQKADDSVALGIKLREEQKKVFDLKQELEDIKRSHNVELKILENQLGKADNNNNNSKGIDSDLKLKESERKLRDLESKLKEEQSATKKIQEQYQTLQTQNQKANSSVAQYEKEIQNLSKQISILSSKDNVQSKELSALREDRSKALELELEKEKKKTIFNCNNMYPN